MKFIFIALLNFILMGVSVFLGTLICFENGSIGYRYGLCQQNSYLYFLFPFILSGSILPIFLLITGKLKMQDSIAVFLISLFSWIFIYISFLQIISR